MQTALTTLLGIDLPIIQAPIGSATCAGLAAAVSNAGGLGTLAGSWRSPADLRDLIRQTRALTSRPIAVNLVLAWPQQERLMVALEEGVKIISLFWGDPAPCVGNIHEAGAVLLHSVGSAEEASKAAAAGADALVLQGWEAGGHVRGTTPALTLLDRVRGALPGIPVALAGGVGDAHSVREALGLGADAVWVGTRFLASAEAAVHPVYQQALIAASGDDTVYTTLFDGGWPDAPHRVLRNQTVRRWEEAGQPPAGRRPGEGDILARYPDGRPAERYSDTIPVKGMTGRVGELALYAGTSVEHVHRVEPAGAIVEELAGGGPPLGR
jgi:NAD(P)H-dependent flavin oxidoreductase YrpB (nitropropane dioxygenase family)